MLNKSRLYTFLDNKTGFSISFIEGQRLIADLATIHNFNKDALHFHRNTVLTSMQLLNFLKPKENLGFYIDSNEPYFRFKLELHHSGSMRTLLLPLEFSSFPKKITGSVRLTKIFSDSKVPYSSILQANNEEYEDLINNILKDSYQTNSQILLASTTDQSVMVTKLPPMNIKVEVWEDITLKEYINEKKTFLEDLFNRNLNSTEEIISYFGSHSFQYLMSKEIEFSCPCSKDRMMQNLFTLHQHDLEEVFQGDNSIDITCDYCNKVYEIHKNEFNLN